MWEGVKFWCYILSTKRGELCYTTDGRAGKYAIFILRKLHVPSSHALHRYAIRCLRSTKHAPIRLAPKRSRSKGRHPKSTQDQLRLILFPHSYPQKSHRRFTTKITTCHPFAFQCKVKCLTTDCTRPCSSPRCMSQSYELSCEPSRELHLGQIHSVLPSSGYVFFSRLFDFVFFLKTSGMPELLSFVSCENQ